MTWKKRKPVTKTTIETNEKGPRLKIPVTKQQMELMRCCLCRLHRVRHNAASWRVGFIRTGKGLRRDACRAADLGAYSYVTSHVTR
jgi:hypothetical protein